MNMIAEAGIAGWSWEKCLGKFACLVFGHAGPKITKGHPFVHQKKNNDGFLLVPHPIRKCSRPGCREIFADSREVAI